VDSTEWRFEWHSYNRQLVADSIRLRKCLLKCVWSVCVVGESSIRPVGSSQSVTEMRHSLVPPVRYHPGLPTPYLPPPPPPGESLTLIPLASESLT